MKLSNVKEQGVFLLNGTKAIVVRRDTADRSSGLTEVSFQDGSRHLYVWDHEDPEVAYLGQGKLETRIIDPPKQDYVLGFAMTKSDNERRVLLIEKARPDWQKGLLNGVGGKIEHGEHTLDAMVREFREETGIRTDPIAWTYFASLTGQGYEVSCYCAFMTEEILNNAESPDKKEPLTTVLIADLSMWKVIPNLRFLIPLALDRTVMPVTFKEVKR